jgi:hypothetical protein
MKNSLEELFGSKERWRLIKLFVLNDDVRYTAREVVNRNKMDGRKVSGIIRQFVKAGFLKEETIKKKKYYKIDKKFPFFDGLKQLVIRSNVYPQCASLGKIGRLGNVRLGLVSGVFSDNKAAKADLLIVGDHISNAKMNHLLNDLEIELGREINYSLMDLNEFKYRVDMFDKFILEFFEGPHEILVNKVQSEIMQLKRAKKIS